MNKLKILMAILFFNVSCFIGTASAVIIDNGSYTTVNGIDWLDWSTTHGMTQTDALARYNRPGYGNAFRLAEHDEILDMLTEINGGPIIDDLGNSWGGRTVMFQPSFDHLFAVIDLFGQTRPHDEASDRSFAYIDGVGIYGVGEEIIYAAHTYGDSGRFDSGVPLVRVNVPTPSTSIVFLMLLAVLGFKQLKPRLTR